MKRFYGMWVLQGPRRAVLGIWPSGPELNVAVGWSSDGAAQQTARETGFELDASAPGASTRAFDHLLERAVALDYRDHADDLGEVVRDLKNAAIGDRPREAKRQKVEDPAPPDPAAEDPRRPLDEPPRWTDLDAPETRRCLRELAEALAVDPETVARGSDPEAFDAMAFDALADACARNAERLVAPFWSRVIAAEEATTASASPPSPASPASPASPGRGAPWGLVPGDFPPGIELGGPGGSSPLVVAAVETLRVMHVNDLRELQSAVDALLVQMQEYTGDPRTDAALGRVGEG